MEKEITFVDGSINFTHLRHETLFTIYRILNEEGFMYGTQYNSEPENYYVDKINIDLTD